MIICVGTGGSGKTLLLKVLSANSDPGSVSKHVATVPTTGSNIVKIQRTKPGEMPEMVSAREIGGKDGTSCSFMLISNPGSMAPIWKSMVEPNKTQVKLKLTSTIILRQTVPRCFTVLTPVPQRGLVAPPSTS